MTELPAAHAHIVGNDVLDMADPRLPGRHLDRRFLERVFDPAERDAILTDPDPDRALWLSWAAKEAAYKVVSKLMNAPPPFEHVAFRVRLDDAGAGRVEYRGRIVPFREIGGDPGRLLHVLAWAGESPPDAHAATAELPSKPPPPDRFTPREAGAVHSPPSGWVRLLAREHAAQVLAVPEGDLEIVCLGGPTGRTPPRLYLHGEPSSHDVSLSHHGRQLGWAVSTVPEGGSPGRPAGL